MLRLRQSAPLALVAALLAACQTAAPATTRGSPTSETPAPSTAPPAPPDEVKIAFLEQPIDGAIDVRSLPPYQGAELALALEALTVRVPVDAELVPVEVGEDPAAVTEVVGDPAFVAAIVAPNVRDAAAVEALVPRGIPVVSLSPHVGAPPDSPPAIWRRLVPRMAEQAIALAAHVDAFRPARSGVCVFEDRASAAGLTGPLTGALEREVVAASELSPAAIADEVAAAGCRVVVWDGDGASASEVALDLASADLRRVTLLGGDLLRYPDFIALAGRAAEGTVSSCGCADLSTSTDVAAQRFIQDYQSQFGVPPGPYAVEAWDAARLVLQALREGGTSREGIRAWLAGTGSFEGLGSSYAFDGSGELADPSLAVRLAEVRGGRWIPL